MILVSSTTSGENSVRVTRITVNKFEGFRISCNRMKRCSNMFALNTYFTFRRLSKKRFRNEIQVNYFLDRIKVDMSQFTMPDITTLNVQSNKNRNFIIKRIYYTLRRKMPLQTKPFPIKILDLEITNLLDFHNPIVSSKK